jgi:hypothetical protein
MTQDFRPGEVVPLSGVYGIRHAPLHPAMPREIIVAKGRKFPTCPQCNKLTYRLVRAAKHVREVPPLFTEQDLVQVGAREE